MRRHRCSDRQTIDPDPVFFVVLAQGSGPLSKYRELLPDQVDAVIDPFHSIPSHIVPYSAEYVFFRTVQNDQRVHLRHSFQIPCLSLMTWHTVQYEQIVLREGRPFQKQRDDLFGQRKMLILQQ
ncbi:MAG: hypothetical protein A2010_15570 [Nitrospirae bacterium GWD2_57_9]|nr:MAG: hypothetical protein A2010_15570 [Nitrospirae bacterium GWD2_57_9]OGW48117.1 MAG: hypothetical protein A2078_00655 [Nitrospirae bacterium GWC2_57_9]